MGSTRPDSTDEVEQFTWALAENRHQPLGSDVIGLRQIVAMAQRQSDAMALEPSVDGGDPSGDQMVLLDFCVPPDD